MSSYQEVAPNCPCENCKTRTWNCHGICPSYKAWQRKQEVFSRKVKMIQKDHIGHDWTKRW